MSRPVQGSRIIPTFMTHGMSDEDVLAVATGRETEFRRIVRAIEKSRAAAPGSLQHVVLYGSRGFGKSFMVRRIEIEVKRLSTPDRPVHFILLPEEQHNLQRSPHAFLDYLTERLHDAVRASTDDTAFEKAMFQWPDQEGGDRRWREAAERFEAALDEILPEGLAIVAVENFDTLLKTLFADEEAEQRLRQWLDRRHNRVMLFATATGTVDIKYDRPLFQAFEPVRLAPWSPDDCIGYFERLRASQGKPKLTAEQEAKARAIADFIGGTPRLAQLLGEVIETEDALTVAETMNALTDRLAEYYRRRIEDLPPLARGLLDALIRGGEPASQTELAARVSAGGQNRIARVTSDLQRADIIRGRPAPDSREMLYQVTDRVFVHYYRLRQGSRTARETPLATVLDFLRSFYTREEKGEQAVRHLDAGRYAEAALFGRLARDERRGGANGYERSFERHLEAYLEPLGGSFVGRSPRDIAILLSNDPIRVETIAREANGDHSITNAICAVVSAQAFHRMAANRHAEEKLRDAFASASDDDACVILVDQLSIFLSHVVQDNRQSALAGVACEAISPRLHVPGLERRRLLTLAWSLGALSRHEEAITWAEQAATLAREAGDYREEADAIRNKAWSLGGLRRYDEAITSAERVGGLAREEGDRGLEAEATRLKAWSLGGLRRYDEAITSAERAADLAGEAGDKREEARATCHKAWSLGQLGRHEEAITSAERAAGLAREASDKDKEAEATLIKALSLFGLEQFEESWSVASEAIPLAREAGNDFTLMWAVDHALRVARTLPRQQAVELHGDWLRHFRSRNSGVDERLPKPFFNLNDAFIAAARASSFEALDRILDEHGAWLLDQPGLLYFYREDGLALAKAAEREGRAAVFGMVEGLMPRIAAFMSALGEAKQDEIWLVDLMSGFAEGCRDPGLLRDVAGLITNDLAHDADDVRRLLLAIADVDAADDPETLLARLDPDQATIIRRLRDLPEIEPKKPKRKKRR